MNGIIYCYTNLENGKKYVGQTCYPDRRYKQHIRSARLPSQGDYNTPFHCALRKYGIENFKYEILDQADTIEELDKLEIYYINILNSLAPSGYNIATGGHHPVTPDLKTKKKMSGRKGYLSEEEVIYLRKAYANHESPMKIYYDKYADRMHKNAFLNIWVGSRYKHIMPEVFTESHRHTKLNEEIVKQVKIERKNGLSCKKIADKLGLTKSTVEGICNGRTWKQVQI